MIEENYLEDEVREGFFVPAMIKRAWAAELEVLEQIDRICKKYNIQYFAEWGTLLGAVRHNGFIPWDDDIDIGMKRADYERFLEAASKELPEGYRINNCRNRTDFWLFLARVINTEHMNFTDGYLKNNYEFPYIAGVDIFLLDYVSRDEKKERDRDVIADYIINLADYIAERKIDETEAVEGLRQINLKVSHRLDYDETSIRRWLTYSCTDNEVEPNIKEYIDKLHQNMYIYAEKMFDAFTDEESDELTQLFPFGLRRKEHRYPKKYYEDCIRMPFENTTIPVPVGYNAMLTRRYGDYLAIHKSISGHDYPFFESQQKQLDSLTGTTLPQYSYNETEINYANGNYTGMNEKDSFRQLAVEVCQQLGYLDDVQAAQELAIDFGTMIEKLYGEGHVTVTLLEEYCEQLYIYASGGTETSKVIKIVEKISQSVYEEFIYKKEIAFIVSRVSEWKFIKDRFKQELEKGDNIYIVVVPYFHKRFDGTLCDMKYEYEGFSEVLNILDVSSEYKNNVKLVGYDEYDITLHQPYCVYIQNPYDEWNYGISIHPSYYTSNIVKNTKCMVYVPPFIVDDFDRENGREYHNMAVYALMPGVVRADRVFVQSKSMRRVYIDKLTEWAGEKTRSVWETKISDSGKQREVYTQEEYDIKKNMFSCIPKSWIGSITKKDGTHKKIVMYHSEISMFLENKEMAFAKIDRAFDVFEADMDEVFMLWHISSATIDIIKRKLPDFICKIEQLEKRAQTIGAYDRSDGRRAVQVADAFYGDGCYLSRLFQIAGKPIMIGNVDI